MADRNVRVCVDAMGGDEEPSVVLEGIAQALEADPALTVLVAGDADVVEPFVAAHPDRTEAVITTQVITMEDHPAAAIRSKRDSSIVVGCKLVKEGKADAFFSAGSTGAVLAAATLVVGRIRGVQRPFLINSLPTEPAPTVVGDLGANADVKPEYLLQFGQMGAMFSHLVVGVEKPRVGLLNIGSEDTKGSQAAIEAHELLREKLPEFAGNAEGNDITAGTFDVIITDGFTGNVALKTMEGTAKFFMKGIKGAFMRSTLTKLAAVLLKGGLKDLKDRFDPDVIGGAHLLGIDGVVVIGHGKTSPRAVRNAIAVCTLAVRADLVDSIAERVSEHTAPAAG